jgi:hypothetical protein
LSFSLPPSLLLLLNSPSFLLFLHPSPQVTATDTTVKDLSSLNLEGAVETFLADDVVVGGTYNYAAAVAKPEEIYIKKSFDVKMGDLALDARYRLPNQVAALTATLKRTFWGRREGGREGVGAACVERND